jgi:hypothetical protein
LPESENCIILRVVKGAERSAVPFTTLNVLSIILDFFVVKEQLSGEEIHNG